MDLPMCVNRSKAIFFDLFHTLFSFTSEGIQGKGTSELLGVSEERWNRALFELSEERLKGRDRDKYSIIRSLAQRCGIEPSEEVVRSVSNYREERFRKGLLNTSKRRLEVLWTLKRNGKKLGLISNADAIEVSGWNESALSEPFDAVVFSFEVGYMKPEPEIYEEALARLGIAARDALFVGDGSSEELKGARAVGMTTVLTTEIIKEKWPERIETRRAHADYLIDDLCELLG